MTEKQQHKARLDEALAPVVARAAGLIGRRLADARLHAGLGSLDRAAERLAELEAGLAGAAGVIPTARAQFYRAAHGEMARADRFDPRMHRRLEPDAAGEAVARTGPVGGRSYGPEAAALLQSAAIDLAAVAAGPHDGRAAGLDAWEARHRGRLEEWAHRALSDSQMAIHSGVERIHVQPGIQ